MARPDVLLRLSDGEKSFGERVLFRHAKFWLEPRERAVLVGPNGAGKSTLFQALAGRLPLDEGKLERPRGTTVVYLPQDFRPSSLPPGGEATLYGTAYAITPLYRAERELETLPPERAGEAWNRVRELSFWKGRVAKTLADFGLGGLWESPVGGLSGGEGVRLGLAMTFLSGADVLLLDEPTTHLDLKMRLWLEEMLLAYRGAVALISHDRALVARVATTVYHLEAGVLVRVPGGYSTYLQERERVRRTIQKARKEADKERERLTASADSMRPFAQYSAKKSRQRDSLIRRAQRIEAPDPLPPERRWSLEIAAEGTPKLVLEAKDLAKSYVLRQTQNADLVGAQSFASGARQNQNHADDQKRQVIKNATLRIFRGDRIALVGTNGAGKTTLLRLLLSREFPDAGERTLGLGVGVAYLDQLYHGLEPDKSLFVQFSSRFGEARAAALLGRVGFRPPHWNDPPQSFSGGERARAGLALLGALRAGLLVMDEPTNHIELELLEALERALSDYPGTLLFVSHDRTLIKRVATRFWGLEDGILVEYPNYAEAEAAMLGKPAVRLNPYGELPPETEASAEERNLEDERLALLERLHEVRLTDRSRARLRADLLAVEDELDRRYAHEFYLPVPYRYRVRQGGLEVFADYELSYWRFWSSAGGLEGEYSNKILHLEGHADSRVLQAALRVAFELEGVQVVRYGKQTFGRDKYLEEFKPSAWVDERRPPGKRRRRKPKRPAPPAPAV
ncbi:MAG: ABC-F family ATP-binding cassette domain-containing protein [Thermaceae bacterium]|nr:ABC-F family ATP-binding cassette domain-containing protein [Thermaceae bacterium]